MEAFCFSCSKKVDIPSNGRPGRKESCTHCGADLHACKNCTFYDATSYNMCRERSADRVVEKERANFCDYFHFRDGKCLSGTDTSKSNTLKKLDDLFK